MRKKTKTKHTILKGEGTNQHTLYGKFGIEEVEDYPSVDVKEKTILKHEMPNG